VCVFVCVCMCVYVCVYIYIYIFIYIYIYIYIYISVCVCVYVCGPCWNQLYLRYLLILANAYMYTCACVYTCVRVCIRVWVCVCDCMMCLCQHRPKACLVSSMCSWFRIVHIMRSKRMQAAVCAHAPAPPMSSVIQTLAHQIMKTQPIWCSLLKHWSTGNKKAHEGLKRVWSPGKLRLRMGQMQELKCRELHRLKRLRLNAENYGTQRQTDTRARRKGGVCVRMGSAQFVSHVIVCVSCRIRQRLCGCRNKISMSVSVSVTERNS
jgi:hypothetical protein